MPKEVEPTIELVTPQARKDGNGGPRPPCIPDCQPACVPSHLPRECFPDLARRCIPELVTPPPRPPS